MEPGQRAWLARQQRAWRRGALLHEQVLLLALSGCHLELYEAVEWRQTAHDVAAYLMGCQIQPVRLALTSHLDILQCACSAGSACRMRTKERVTLCGTTTCTDMDLAGKNAMQACQAVFSLSVQLRCSHFHAGAGYALKGEARELCIAKSAISDHLRPSTKAQPCQESQVSAR